MYIYAVAVSLQDVVGVADLYFICMSIWADIGCSVDAQKEARLSHSLYTGASWQSFLYTEQNEPLPVFTVNGIPSSIIITGTRSMSQS